MLIGIVGKPSTGKSSFFKASTMADVDIANYPFTTIEPNHAVGFVNVECADKFFNVQCNPRTGFCLNHNRFIPVDLLDVAGLVPGAYKGLGCGNQFLDDLNRADVLIHIIDASGSTNEKGESVEALSYDPCKDVEFLEEELDQWFLRLINKGWDKFVRQVKQERFELSKAIAKQLSGLGVTEELADEILKDFKLDIGIWNESDVFRFAKTLRRRTKPMLIVANKADIPGASENIKRLKENFKEYKFIVCSAETEIVLKEAAKKKLIKYVPGSRDFEIVYDINDQQKEALEFIRKNVLNVYGSTGVQDALNYAVFDLLKYIAVFPGGVNRLCDSEGRILPDCFLLPYDSTALAFAYKLHTDLGDKFIRAIDVKKRLTVGKDYLLKNCDVIEIVSGR
jgi:ribosome-binding ATPase YchF (GTP1/OBG family)